MATQGSYNGHERKETEGKFSKEGENNNIREYRARDSRGNGDTRGNGEHRGGKGGDYRQRDNQNNGEYRRKDNRSFRTNDGKGEGVQTPKGEYKPRDNRGGGYKPKDNRNSYGGGYNSFAKDKDEDDGKKVFRSAKPKTVDKPKEPQPDKFETIKRLEREQKTIKKKESKRNKAESTRPQQKVKRQNNRNILNDYANGMYDDYEDDF